MHLTHRHEKLGERFGHARVLVGAIVVGAAMRQRGVKYVCFEHTDLIPMEPLFSFFCFQPLPTPSSLLTQAHHSLISHTPNHKPFERALFSDARGPHRTVRDKDVVLAELQGISVCMHGERVRGVVWS